MSSAIAAEHLGKVYAHAPPGVAALSEVSVDIPTGGVYGLIGRNGAGKTTFIRIAGTQLAASSGTMRVLGHDIRTEERAIRARIACVPQESRPLYFLRTEEVVYLYLKMRGMPTADARRRTRDALEELSLTEHRKRLVSRLSGGTRRRVMCAMVLASDADIMFLDEPTTGLDPLARREVWQAIRRASREHSTILLTTHYLDEADALSHRLYIVERGRVIVTGTAEDLKRSVGGTLKVTIPAGRPEIERFRSFGSCVVDGEVLTVIVAPERLGELMDVAVRSGLSVTVGPVTLEEAFLRVVGRSINED